MTEYGRTVRERCSESAGTSVPDATATYRPLFTVEAAYFAVLGLGFARHLEPDQPPSAAACLVARCAAKSDAMTEFSGWKHSSKKAEL